MHTEREQQAILRALAFELKDAVQEAESLQSCCMSMSVGTREHQSFVLMDPRFYAETSVAWRELGLATAHVQSRLKQIKEYMDAIGFVLHHPEYGRRTDTHAQLLQLCKQLCRTS